MITDRLAAGTQRESREAIQHVPLSRRTPVWDGVVAGRSRPGRLSVPTFPERLANGGRRSLGFAESIDEPRQAPPPGAIPLPFTEDYQWLPRAVLIGASSLALAGGTVFGLVGASGQAGPAAPVQGVQLQAADAKVAAAAAPKVTRDQVIANAKTWNPHTSSRVPYSQSKTHGGYRTDCSGYASMTLRLPSPARTRSAWRRPPTARASRCPS